ncbi:hypothetical protein ACFYXV_28900 [Streptomyces sp. NPDC002181]|uniref:hypothetical protein n=1 Tax=unclassified Streptomyces TaxID=2593676 RepID=UPI00365A9E67
MSAYDLADAFRLDPRAETAGPRTADSAAFATRDVSLPDWVTTGCADPGPARRQPDGR